MSEPIQIKFHGDKVVIYQALSNLSLTRAEAVSMAREILAHSTPYVPEYHIWEDNYAYSKLIARLRCVSCPTPLTRVDACASLHYWQACDYTKTFFATEDYAAYDNLIPRLKPYDWANSSRNHYYVEYYGTMQFFTNARLDKINDDFLHSASCYPRQGYRDVAYARRAEQVRTRTPDWQMTREPERPFPDYYWD
jgi:hypothetical protein